MPKCLLHAVSVALAVLLLWSQAGPGPAMAEEKAAPLTLFVFHRPPYYILDQGRPAGGFLLDIALAVLDRAGIPYNVEEMPPNRILSVLSARDIQACAVGWLRTSEREAFARYSAPLYHNRPLGVAVNAKTPPFGGTHRLDTLLKAGLTWGLREGFSYGPAIDAAFAAYPAQKIRRFSSNQHLLRLLAHKRLDAILIEPEELSWHLSQEPELAASLRLLPLADAPAGFSRHILCDAAVPPAVMDRIDAALAAYLATAEGRQRAALTARH